MLRLFHQRINVDAVEPAPARSPSSAKRESQQKHVDAAPKSEPGAYVPMTLPNVSYDDFTAGLTPRADDWGHHSKDTSATMTSGSGAARRPLMGLLPGWTAARRSRGPSLNASHESVPGGIPLTVDRSRHRRSDSPSQRVVTSGERIASLSAERRGLRSSPTIGRASSVPGRPGVASSSVPRSPSNVPLDATSQMLLINDDAAGGTPRRSGHAVTPPASATVIRPHVTSAAALRAHNGGRRRGGTAATTPNTTANASHAWVDPLPGDARGGASGAVTPDDHSPEPHLHDDASYDESEERSMATPPQNRVAGLHSNHPQRGHYGDASHPASAGPSSRQHSRRPSVSVARGDGGASHSHRASAARGAGHHYEALTALVQGLRVRAKMQSKFATGIFGQIMEARSWIDELDKGADLPFSAPALWQQISVWRGQLKNYALSDVAVPISFANLRAEYHKRHHHHHHHHQHTRSTGGRRSRSSRSKGATDGDDVDEGNLERQDTAAPADGHAEDRVSATSEAKDDGGDSDGSGSSSVAPSPPKPRRPIKMLRRGAGLRRFYGDAKPPQPDEAPVPHHADPTVAGAAGVNGSSPQAADTDAPQETGLTGAARLAALAAPKRKTQPHHAALSHRSPSAGTAAPPHRTHAAHVAAGSPPGRSGSSTARVTGGGGDASPPQPRRASSLPSRPQQGSASPRQGDHASSPPSQQSLGTPPLARHSDRESADDRRREERRMAAAMAVPLDPELTALLAPSSGYEPWRLEHALRRPGGSSSPGAQHGGKQPPAGLFASASAARELLAPFASSGRDFNRLIDNLTGLL